MLFLICQRFINVFKQKAGTTDLNRDFTLERAHATLHYTRVI